MPDFEAQVEQLQAVIQGKESQITSLTEQVQSLGAFKSEALNSRDEISGLKAQVATLEADKAAAVKDAAAAKSAASLSELQDASAQKKLAAAQKVAEGLKELIG